MTTDEKFAEANAIWDQALGEDDEATLIDLLQKMHTSVGFLLQDLDGTRAQYERDVYEHGMTCSCGVTYDERDMCDCGQWDAAEDSHNEFRSRG